MTRKLALNLMPLALAFALPICAQAARPEMTPEQKAWQKASTPSDPHTALAKMAGNYDVVVKSWHAPGEPGIEKGTATRSMMLGDRVMVEEFHSSMMGQRFTGHSMRGYNNIIGQHWSTWNDSMSTGLMVSEGSCDAQNACTFTGSWVEPVNKQTVTSRMTTRWIDPTTEVFEMYAPGPDRKEMKMMEITYTKKP